MLPLFGASRKQYGFVHCLLLRLPSEGGDYSVPACDDIIGSCPGKQKSLQGDKETSPTYDVTEKTVVEIKKERGGGEDKNKHLYIGNNNNICSAFSF